MKVDNRFLRMPWNILLGDFINNFEEYLTFLPESLKDIFEQGTIRKGVIEHLIAEYDFEDGDEQKWRDDGISHLLGNVNVSTKIKYDEVLLVKTNKEAICFAIARKHKIHANKYKEKSYLSNSEKLNISRICRELNGELSKTTKNASGTVRIFTKAGVTTKAMASKIIAAALKVATEDPKAKNAKQMILSISAEFHKEFPDSKDSKSDFGFYDGVIKRHHSLWNAGDRLQHFKDSRWLCFQRTDGCFSNSSNYGISISPLEIRYQKENHRSHYGVFMQSNYHTADSSETQTYEYTGMVTDVPSTNSLIFELWRDHKDRSPEAISYIVLTLTSEVKPDLLVGFHMYYSVTSSRYITKTIVFMNLKKTELSFDIAIDDWAQPAEKLFPKLSKDYNPEQHAQQFYDIPLQIRQFLAKREENRLTQPSTRLSSLNSGDKSLVKWMSNRHGLEGHPILTACQGDYSIYYYYGERIANKDKTDKIFESVRKDRLRIRYDENLREYHAVFNHERTRKADFVGKVGVNGQTVEISAEYNGGDKYNTTDLNMVYISFSIPTHDKGVYDKVFKGEKSFEGLLAGCNDNKNTPISFVAYIIKEAEEKNEDEAHSTDLDSTTRRTKVANFLRENRHQLSISLQSYDDRSTYLFNLLVSLYEDKGYQVRKNGNRRELFDPNTKMAVEQSQSEPDALAIPHILSINALIRDLPDLTEAGDQLNPDHS